MVGSHLVDALLARGDAVIVVDNVSTGRWRNLAHLEQRPSLSLIEADIVAPADPPWQIAAVDRVYHLASPASPVDYGRNPIETLMTNAAGTRAALECAARCGARFLLASTSEVYGDPAEHPQRESYLGHVNPVGPRSSYDEGKRFAESLTAAYWRTRGVDVRIARLFNSYGPRSRADDGRVVPTFCAQALTGRPLTIFGTGLQTRSLCYVGDTVRGLVSLMERPGLAGEVVNIGSPDERTILEIARTIIALAGSDSGIERRPLPADDPTRRCPDIARARALLGWEPETSLAEGLRLTLDAFRAELSACTGAEAAVPAGAERALAASGVRGSGEALPAPGNGWGPR
jgi:nucleoside-diphosphate-sugar epimerase